MPITTINPASALEGRYPVTAPSLRFWLVPLLLSLLFGYALWQARALEVAPFAVPAPAEGAGDSALDRLLVPEFESRFASTGFHRHVHSSSIAPLPDGGLISVWFAGSREGAEDVNIRTSRYDPATQRWGEEFKLISRETTERVLQRDIRKLGNPVISLAPNGRLWLFYVSVSMGGWAGSAINAIHSDDGGDSWSAPRRLITSPFLNISTLVRNPPVFHRDGSMGLPVYHEFLGKFAEYLYLSPDGRILDKFRISSGNHSLQPAIVPLGGDSALALLRNAGVEHGKVLATYTRDRGRTWSEHVPVAPWNPDSAVAAIGEGDGHILVALNDIADGRFRLTLYQTDETLKNWRQVAVLDESPRPEEWVEPALFRDSLHRKYTAIAEDGEETPGMLAELQRHAEKRACRHGSCTFKYEYPTLIRAANGDFHMVYSWNNTLIKHVVFNHAWVERG
ncbi:MAG TPA: sialidase family protein [Porticoccaceae bacterium]|nr:sialidase family protein [Porticoccaceae bacterium]